METAKQTAGFVLAGGGSSRMGRDKALLELDGVALVLRTAKLVESVSGGPWQLSARLMRTDPLACK